MYWILKTEGPVFPLKPYEMLSTQIIKGFYPGKILYILKKMLKSLRFTSCDLIVNETKQWGK